MPKLLESENSLKNIDPKFFEGLRFEIPKSVIDSMTSLQNLYAFMAPQFESVAKLATVHSKAISRLAEAVTSVNTPTFEPMYLPPIRTEPVREVVYINNDPVPYDNSPKILEELSMTLGGGFVYKKEVLEKPSMDSEQGVVLSLFLKNQSTFIADSQIVDELKTVVSGNKDKIFEIIKYLKKDFKKQGLKIVIKRRSLKDGYELIGIKPL